MKNDTLPFLENLLNDESFRNWAKKSNKNDTAFWNSWIQDNPDRIAVVYEAKAIVLGISFNKRPINEETVIQKLDAVLSRIETKRGSEIRNPKRFFTSKIKIAVSVAAIGIIFVLIGFNVYNTSQVVIHKTGYGEIINLKLPDGTYATLNGNSAIRYNKKNPRNVTLEGEAYFKVAPKYSTHAKFWVNTKDLRVEVFGTQFNVNTRDEKTYVLLDEGSVKLLLKNGLTKKMIPGEFVSYSVVNEEITHTKINNSSGYVSWREDTYIFNNITLKEVMKYIEHTYGLTSEFEKSTLEKRIISGGIPGHDLDICLSAIEKSTGTRIIRTGNTLFISNK